MPEPLRHIVWEAGSKGNIVVSRGRNAYTCAAICDVSWHWNIKGARGIIPIELDTTVQIPCPVHGCFDAFDYMIDVFLTHIFHSKIVLSQCEQDKACGMLPQTGGVWTLTISVWEQMLLQQFVCQNAGLGEAPHCAAHLKVNNPVQCKFVQIIFCSYSLWK